jgi:hypothetical protein
VNGNGYFSVESRIAEVSGCRGEIILRSSRSGGSNMSKDHGPSIKDDEQYDELRKKGESKEKAARIANTGRSTAGRRGGKSGSYEDWSKKDLQERAREIGVEGRSKMNKGELIEALRNH